MVQKEKQQEQQSHPLDLLMKEQDEIVDWFNQGNELADRGKVKETIAAYTRAIEDDPLAYKSYPEQLPPELAGQSFDPADGIYTSMTYLERF